MLYFGDIYESIITHNISYNLKWLDLRFRLFRIRLKEERIVKGLKYFQTLKESEVIHRINIRGYTTNANEKNTG